MDQMESCVPPGFRFRPTEEELVGYYLKRKINSINTDLDVIVDIDLYKMEPWDIQERCNLGYNDQNEWYFFNHKDKKYPTGTRTNRATTAGFWKATGRDKAVLSKTRIIGMRKTLVFYKGRAPNGRRSDWILHEYRLQSTEHAPPHEEGWVVCRAFKKPTPNHRQGYEAWSHACYARQHNNIYPSFSDISTNSTTSNTMYPNQDTNVHKTLDSDDAHDLIMMSCNNINESPFLNYNNQLIDLPQLESPTISTSLGLNQTGLGNVEDCFEDEKYVDWKNLESLIDPNMGLATNDCDRQEVHDNNAITWNGLL